jgi:hypothetical protein
MAVRSAWKSYPLKPTPTLTLPLRGREYLVRRGIPWKLLSPEEERVPLRRKGFPRRRKEFLRSAPFPKEIPSPSGGGLGWGWVSMQTIK